MFLEKFQEKSGVQVQASRTSGALGPMPLTELLQIGAPTCFEKFTNRVGRAGGGGRKGARAGGLYRGPPAFCTPLIWSFGYSYKYLDMISTYGEIDAVDRHRVEVSLNSFEPVFHRVDCL